MLKLDNKDLSAIASSRASRNKLLTIISNVGTVIGAVWLAVLVGMVIYGYKVSGYTIRQALTTDLFQYTMASLFYFMVLVVVVGTILWAIIKRRIFKVLKEEYKN